MLGQKENFLRLSLILQKNILFQLLFIPGMLLKELLNV